jgi:predicted O-linked N-acetylglucosamine transferase (SPINDLY family)
MIKGIQSVDAHTVTHWREWLVAHGIAADRLHVARAAPSVAEHLRTYERIDIALDPFPYNGTTTTCEALWMGVPVVTLEGDRHAGRVGASLLAHAGLDELIARTPDSYVAAAVELARDPARLAAFRAGLRPRMAVSSLTDAAGFTRTIEAAYRAMWRTWCESVRVS